MYEKNTYIFFRMRIFTPGKGISPTLLWQYKLEHFWKAIYKT